MDHNAAYVSSANLLLEEGFIAIDENGNARLTDKGKKRATARLDKLPDSDQILLDIAFCEGHEIAVSIF